MGFGDVTLMAMIGAFLGWQAGLLVFFLAPFAGIVLGLLVVVLRRDSEIPYGPFLCLGAVAVLVFWASFWRLHGGHLRHGIAGAADDLLLPGAAGRVAGPAANRQARRQGGLSLVFGPARASRAKLL